MSSVKSNTSTNLRQELLARNRELTNVQQTDEVQVQGMRVREDSQYTPQYGDTSAEAIRFDRLVDSLRELEVRDKKEDRSEEHMGKFTVTMLKFARITKLVESKLTAGWEDYKEPDNKEDTGLVETLMPKLMQYAESIRDIFDEWLDQPLMPPTEVILEYSKWASAYRDKVENISMMLARVNSRMWCSTRLYSSGARRSISTKSNSINDRGEQLTPEVVKRYGRDLVKKRYKQSEVQEGNEKCILDQNMGEDSPRLSVPMTANLTPVAEIGAGGEGAYSLMFNKESQNPFPSQQTLMQNRSLQQGNSKKHVQKMTTAQVIQHSVLNKTPSPISQNRDTERKEAGASQINDKDKNKVTHTQSDQKVSSSHLLGLSNISLNEIQGNLADCKSYQQQESSSIACHQIPVHQPIWKKPDTRGSHLQEVQEKQNHCSAGHVRNPTDTTNIIEAEKDDPKSLLTTFFQEQMKRLEEVRTVTGNQSLREQEAYLSSRQMMQQMFDSQIQQMSNNSQRSNIEVNPQSITEPCRVGEQKRLLSNQQLGTESVHNISSSMGLAPVDKQMANQTTSMIMAAPVSIEPLVLPSFSGKQEDYRNFRDYITTALESVGYPNTLRTKYLWSKLDATTQRRAQHLDLIGPESYDALLAELDEMYHREQLNKHLYTSKLLAIATWSQATSVLQVKALYDYVIEYLRKLRTASGNPKAGNDYHQLLFKLCPNHVQNLLVDGEKEESIDEILKAIKKHLNREESKANRSGLNPYKQLSAKKQIHNILMVADERENMHEAERLLGVQSRILPEIETKDNLGAYVIQRKPHMSEEYTKQPYNVRSTTEKRRWNQGRVNQKHSEWKEDCSQMNQTEVTKTEMSPSTYTPLQRCVFCHKSHNSHECKVYEKTGLYWDEVNRRKICRNCLAENHKVENCPYSSFCACKQLGVVKHSMILHNREKGDPVVVGSVVSMQIGEDSQPRLLTAKVKVKKEKGNEWWKKRIFLDSGSMATLIPRMVAQEMGLPVLATEMFNLKAYGSEIKSVKGEWVEMEIASMDGTFTKKIRALSVPQENVVLQGKQLTEDQAQYISRNNLKLADSDAVECKSLPVDILIGVSSYYELTYPTIHRLPGGVVAVGSPFGQMLGGSTAYKEGKITKNLTCNFITVSSRPENFSISASQAAFEQFTRMEGIEEDDDEKDTPVMRDFQRGVKFTDRPETPFPWIEKRKKCLGTHLKLSCDRCNSAFRRRTKEGNEDIQEKVITNLKEQIASGVVEKVALLGKAPVVVDNLKRNPRFYDRLQEDIEGRQVHYMPYMEVYKASSQKLRVVYDGSARAFKRDVSLNDCLEKGPLLTNHIAKVMLEFRKKSVACVGDIEKAFLNIAVREGDKDMLRFLWREGDEISVYRFRRLPFGLTCSPFILAATITTYIERSSLPKDIKEKILSVFYVDDMTASFEDEDEAWEFVSSVKNLLGEMSMPLRKLNSNCQDLKDKFSKINGEEVERDEKVLGIAWNSDSDYIGINDSRIIKHLGNEETKSDVFSVMARFYDPLHFAAPFVFIAKEILRAACDAKIGWKDKLPDELVVKWSRWKEEIKQLKVIKLPRRLLVSHAITIRLAGFSDASGRGYSAVVYVVSANQEGNHDSNFVICKTKLRPVKSQSIPRMELMAACLLSRLMATVSKWLMNWNITRKMYYSDSKAVLYWIKADHRSQPAFISNRIQIINMLTDRCEWRYVASSENPADIPTRGSWLKDLANNQKRWKGPKFILKMEEPVVWEGECPEECAEEMVQVNIVQQQSLGICDLIEQKVTRSYHRLMKITKTVYKAVGKFLKKSGNKQLQEKKRKELSYAEAEKLWFQSIQKHHYKEEIRYCSKIATERPVKTPPRVRWLRLKWDKEDKLLKLSTRNEYESYSEPPILLPYNSDFSRMYIESQHIRLGHAGVKAVLTDVRSLVWIPRARSLVKSVVSRCRVCRLAAAKPFKLPDSPPLPSCRVRQARPFDTVGLDYCGPIILRRGGKAYSMIITCAVTRAVHIEPVKTMSLKDFIHGFSRFMCRRGIPSLVISDNAKTFKAVAKQLKILSELPEVKKYLEHRRVNWRFYTARSPWKGGFIERVVGLFKAVLKRVMARTKLNFEDFSLVNYEAEMVINSRPLTYVYEEAEEGEALTPSKLIIGYNLTDLPPFKEVSWKVPTATLNSRMKTLKGLKNQFWRAWQREYLKELVERHLQIKPVGDVREPEENEVVLIKGEFGVPRMKWKMGRILQVNRSPRDQKIRSILLQPVDKEGNLLQPIERSVNFAIPLEGEIAYCNDGGTQTEEAEDQM